MSIFLTQVALNVFGSMDILPFTGVTFPFVSRGGSSMLSCWMMMAYLKSADTRREASFAVRLGEVIRSVGDREAIKAERRERGDQRKAQKKEKRGKSRGNAK